MKTKKIFLIFNPYAGLKKKTLFFKRPVMFSQVKSLLFQYRISFDWACTGSFGDAGMLSKKAFDSGYNTILAAGGDGTVSEIGSSLVGKNVTLGILPTGTFMNIAKMVGIPSDLKKAVEIIKNGHFRKIDAGMIKLINGERLKKAIYFFESAGIGLTARLQKNVFDIERGNREKITILIKSIFEKSRIKTYIELKERKISTDSEMVVVSNGPYTAMSLPVAPKSRLDDHKLTLSLYKMSSWEIIFYFLGAYWFRKINSRKIKTFQSDKISIYSSLPRSVHIDDRFFGRTPLELGVKADAIRVFCP